MPSGVVNEAISWEMQVATKHKAIPGRAPCGPFSLDPTAQTYRSTPVWRRPVEARHKDFLISGFALIVVNCCNKTVSISSVQKSVLVLQATLFVVVQSY